ncbi:hypothetical protein [Maridesulfovibrio bastinii]|uniref:hypothetical protein n=1 Tax=Maridesulfovibrio bastinii TaxID=47157 RepID=UPI0004149CE8|nr:hypothetical protein [Maridesulfovibrio bastinii]
MTGFNGNQNNGRGMGPCGAGMANRRNGSGMGRGGNSGMGRCMRPGSGRGMGMGAGMGRGMGMGFQSANAANYTNTEEEQLKNRIADLEAEIAELKNNSNK